MISQLTILLTVFLILSIIFFGIYLAKVKGAGKKKWVLLLYLIVTGVLVGLISGLAYHEFTALPFWIFVTAQIWALTVGILHAWLFEKIVPLESNKAGKIFFALAIAFLGYWLMALSYYLYFQIPFPRLFLLPFFLFIAPTFVVIAFDYFTRIPVRIYKVWDFPAPGTLADPSDDEMADPVIVNFEICRNTGDRRTVFKAKAPRSMELGKLYYFFISDYNSRNANNPIEIKEGENKLCKWTFFRTAGIFRGRIRLDPELSISENRIKENDSVICDRIKPLS